MQKLQLVASTLVILAASTVSGQNSVPWHEDFEAARIQAAQSDKLMMLHFTASWCKPCKELERFVFSNPLTIRTLANEVVPVRIDIDRNHELGEKYSIESIPADVMVTAAGHIISSRLSPRTTDGYVTMIKSANQRKGALTPEIVSNSKMLRDATSRQNSQPWQPPTDRLEFKTEDWHTRINSSQTVSGDNFQPARIANSEVSRTSAWQPPNAPHPEATQPVANPRVQANSFVQSIANQAAAPTTPSTANVQNAGFRDSSSAMTANNLESDTSTVQRITPTQNIQKKSELPPMGIDGFCPVTLVQDQNWTKGDRKWGCIHRGRLYLFASQEYRDLFQMTPDMFSPLLGGADPVIFHTEGALVDGQRKLGVFYGEDDGPQLIVLFANQSNRDSFEEDPSKFLATVRQAMAQLDRDTLMR